jgi:hypothetical protein
VRLGVLGILAGRLLDPVLNVNSAFLDPIFGRAWGPPAVHLLAMSVLLIGGVYTLAHAALSRAFPRRPATLPSPS